MNGADGIEIHQAQPRTPSPASGESCSWTLVEDQ
jgi:hypothetical protein